MRGVNKVNTLFESNQPTDDNKRWVIQGDNVKLHGNIHDLLNNYDDALTESYTFSLMFTENSSIVDASKLILPAVFLSESCYYGMFYGCSSLTTAPELPATTLANGCYGYIAVVANNLYFSDRFDLILQQLSGLKEVKDISKDLEFKLGLAYSSAYAIVMGYKPPSNKLLEALGQHYRTKILVCFSPNDNCFGPYINFSPAENWELQGWDEDLLEDIRSQIDLVPHYEEVEEDDSPIAYEEVDTELDSIFNGQESSFDLVTAFKGLDKAQRDLVLAFAQTRAKLDKDKELIVLEYCLSRIKDNSIEDLITSMSNQNTF